MVFSLALFIFHSPIIAVFLYLLATPEQVGSEASHSAARRQTVGIKASVFGLGVENRPLYRPVNQYGPSV